MYMYMYTSIVGVGEQCGCEHLCQQAKLTECVCVCVCCAFRDSTSDSCVSFGSSDGFLAAPVHSVRTD